MSSHHDSKKGSYWKLWKFTASLLKLQHKWKPRGLKKTPIRISNVSVTIRPYHWNEMKWNEIYWHSMRSYAIQPWTVLVQMRRLYRITFESWNLLLWDRSWLKWNQQLIDDGDVPVWMSIPVQFAGPLLNRVTQARTQDCVVCRDATVYNRECSENEFRVTTQSPHVSAKQYKIV